MTGDPKDYNTKKDFRNDFSEYRQLILDTRRLFAKLREAILDVRDDMLDAIEGGNKPSMESLDKQLAELLKRRAKLKKSQGLDLTPEEEEVLAS